MSLSPFLLFPLLIFLTTSQNCPKWKCSDDMDDLHPKWCFRYSKTDNYVVSAYPEDPGCHLLHFYDNSDTNLNSQYNLDAPADIQILFNTTLYDKFCGGKNFYKDIIDCSKYCGWTENSTHQGWVEKYWLCDYEQFLADQQTLFNQSLKQKYQLCERDEECASNECQCVPSLEGHSRCTASVYDKIYEIFFHKTCSFREKDQKFAYKSCKGYIYVKLAHYIIEFENETNRLQLDCLYEYTDISAILQIVAEIDKEYFRAEILFYTAVAALVIGTICIIYKILLKD